MMAEDTANDKIHVRWQGAPLGPSPVAIDRCNNRFPYSIVWGPLPPITCCIPCVGHMVCFVSNLHCRIVCSSAPALVPQGITDSIGRIHDFQGPYYIGVDNFMVRCL